MSKKKTTEQFISEAIKVHGDKYDYSKVEYKGCNTDVLIICPIHGEFSQTPTHHLLGCGCKRCMALREPLSKVLEFKDTIGIDYFMRVPLQRMWNEYFDKVLFKKRE